MNAIASKRTASDMTKSREGRPADYQNGLGVMTDL